MLTRNEKEEQVATLRDKFGRATGVFVADYRGLSVGQANDLRARLRGDSAGGEVEYRVTKNSVLRRAASDSPLDVLTETFNGPTAVAISYGDPAALAKVLVGYAKDNEVFEVKGAYLDGRALDGGEIATLATLPTLDELRGTLIGLLNAPATKLVRLLKEPAGQLARLLEARRNALEEAGESGSPGEAPGSV
jgi:large subunit ribosomal protein L10